jgi:hypothetical protein
VGKLKSADFLTTENKIVVGESEENLLACAAFHQAPSWLFPQQSSPPEFHI